ncbi:hypothetical protein BDV10DRAFT_155421 [Aspergillus recurvatus]
MESGTWDHAPAAPSHATNPQDASYAVSSSGLTGELQGTVNKYALFAISCLSTSRRCSIHRQIPSPSFLLLRVRCLYGGDNDHPCSLAAVFVFLVIVRVDDVPCSRQLQADHIFVIPSMLPSLVPQQFFV